MSFYDQNIGLTLPENLTPHQMTLTCVLTLSSGSNGGRRTDKARGGLQGKVNAQFQLELMTWASATMKLPRGIDHKQSWARLSLVRPIPQHNQLGSWGGGRTPLMASQSLHKLIMGVPCCGSKQKNVRRHLYAFPSTHLTSLVMSGHAEKRTWGTDTGRKIHPGCFQTARAWKYVLSI